MTEDHPPHAADLHSAQLTISENCVQYFLFVIDPKLDPRKKLAHLESIRQSTLRHSQELTKDYIWQREEFNLELRNDEGLTYLHGVTDYGDAVEDEWLIVYILREVTKSNANVWVRVADADGEFLLVEAANVLPKWISPENDKNRVWIHQGQLYVIPLNEAAAPKSEPLSLARASDFLSTKSTSLVHSPFIQEEAFYRLGKYPSQIADSTHHSLVTIPRRLAFVLHNVPRAIAPAVEAFYLRDAITLKPVLAGSGHLVFPPEDTVTLSIRFSKVLFAQLKSQKFEPPPRWQATVRETQNEKSQVASTRLETGMKLTCGFEMLAANAHRSKSRIVREMAIVIDDLKEDGDEVLPSDGEIASWPNGQRDDDEAWMDINYEDFERELAGQNDIRGTSSKATGFGDAQTQTDLRKIVSRFEAFLNDDKAGLDGAELEDMDYDDDSDEDDAYDGSDSEDREVGFDEAEFSNMMREMMGFRPEAPASKEPSSTKKHQPTQTSTEREDEEVQQIRDLTSQMESELKEHGALKLDSRDGHAIEGKNKDKKNTDDAHEDQGDDSDQEVDIDYNLAKNLLESFKSQGGMSGPTGNLLGLMGIQLPRDEDDGNEADATENFKRPDPGRS
ncbi:SGT1 protein [Sarocladium implicatum]|nr:SGT1 protein [Sarocladium implicatum]